jgi:hypothetical protein
MKSIEDLIIRLQVTEKKDELAKIYFQNIIESSKNSFMDNFNDICHNIV